MNASMVTVDGLSRMAICWILSEVRDGYRAGRPIYAVTGTGMVSADAETLLALADAIERRADAFVRAWPQRDWKCKKALRDAARMRNRAESFWVWRRCTVCGGHWTDYPLDPCACPECAR